MRILAWLFSPVRAVIRLAAPSAGSRCKVARPSGLAPSRFFDRRRHLIRDGNLEVLVMLLVVHIVRRSRRWYERGGSAA